MKKYLLFDLDGTLTDPKVGITTSVQYALRAFGIEEPDIDKLEPFIGPPLRDSFMGFYDMSAEQAEEAVAKYRERFRDIGIFENEVYRGIPGMLRNLQSHGMVLAVASSKPQVFVERILEHFHLRKFFAVVVGSELDGTRESKDEVVREALRQLFANGPIQREQVYMIGDRRFDVEGARALQVESVGVTYGYGSMEELKAAKADYIVRSVGELEKFLMRGADEDDGASGGPLYRSVGTMFFSFFLFVAARIVVTSLFAIGGLRGVGISALGYLAGGLAVFAGARQIIGRTAEETRLCYLKKELPIKYVLLAFSVAGASVGLNLLLELTRITGSSEAYGQVAESQYASSFWLGLVTFGVVSPVAEELLFRGIIHNSLRRMVDLRAAVFLSSALFGIYHGNPVQGLYGFGMGCLIAYAYEYFGDFKVALAVHAGANILIYGLSCAGEIAGFVSWPVCVGFLAFAAVSLWGMHRTKHVF